MQAASGHLYLVPTAPDTNAAALAKRAPQAAQGGQQDDIASSHKQAATYVSMPSINSMASLYALSTTDSSTSSNQGPQPSSKLHFQAGDLTDQAYRMLGTQAYRLQPPDSGPADFDDDEEQCAIPFPDDPLKPRAAKRFAVASPPLDLSLDSGPVDAAGRADRFEEPDVPHAEITPDSVAVDVPVALAVTAVVAAATATKVKPAVKGPALVLPTPPSDTEKLLYLRSRRYVLLFCGIFSFCAMTAGMALFVRASPAFYWFAVPFFFTACYLTISYVVVGALGQDFDHEAHKDIIAKHSSNPPSVDVYLPVCGEDIEILRNTWVHVSLLDWADLRVHVLDDGASDEVRALATEFGFNYILRDNRPYLRKAGNLRWAFARTTSDLILILDADFTPRSDLLREITPYFDHDPRIAIVQTPQFFEILKEQTWVEQGAGIVQELFYRLVQVNRNRWNASICVGSCAVYRRVALEPFGGTAEIEHSEDVHTGFKLIDAKWKINYVPVCLAKGVCPDQLQLFFTQQYRWAMGSTSLFLSSAFWGSSLNRMQKTAYLTGMLYYSASALGVFTNPMPAILLIWVKPHAVLWYNIAFALPSLILAVFAMRLWAKQPYGWSAIRVKNIQYYAHIFAIKDKLLGTSLGWVPSRGKGKVKSRYHSARQLCQVWVTATTVLILGGSAWRIWQGLKWYSFLPSMLIAVYTFAGHLDFMLNRG